METPPVVKSTHVSQKAGERLNAKFGFIVKVLQVLIDSFVHRWRWWRVVEIKQLVT